MLRLNSLYSLSNQTVLLSLKLQCLFSTNSYKQLYKLTFEIIYKHTILSFHTAKNMLHTKEHYRELLMQPVWFIHPDYPEDDDLNHQPNTTLAPGQCLSWGCLLFRADGEIPHPLSLITALICFLSRTSIDMLP